MTSVQSQSGPGGRLIRHFRIYWPYWLMLLPGLIYMALIRYLPMFGSIMAFEDYTLVGGIFGSKWTGLQMFQKLVTYSDFYKIVRNTLILSALKLCICFPASVILALLLNEVRSIVLKKTIQTVICIPHFISWVIVGGLVFDMFGAHGLFNNARAILGYDTPILAMQKEGWFRPVYVFSSVWKEAGWNTIVYLAAIAGIDPSLYESADIDGASRWQKLKHITFPLILPTVVTLFLLQIGSFLELGFDQISNLYTTMTYSVADVFDTYVYRTGILNGEYSFATAVGLFQSVIGLILVVTFNKISTKVTEDGGLW